MKLAHQLIDKLISHPNRANLILLNKTFMLGIPFNAPHGFKITEIGPEKTVVCLPNRKLNHNHLGGVHACAIATAGEFSAGLTLLALFGMSRCRLIMSELNVVYTYQGRTDLLATCERSQIDAEAMESALQGEGKFVQKMQTILKDKANNQVAIVTTTWQIKVWEKVKTKS